MREAEFAGRRSGFRTPMFLLFAEAGKNDTIARFSWAILRSSATCGDKGASHENSWNDCGMGSLARLFICTFTEGAGQSWGEI